MSNTNCIFFVILISCLHLAATANNLKIKTTSYPYYYNKPKNAPRCLIGDLKGCTKCAPNYILAAGACVEPISYCDSYYPDGYCQLCKKGFFLIYTNHNESFRSAKIIPKERQCLPDIVGCKNYSFDHDNFSVTCQDCEDGYIKQGDLKCIPKTTSTDPNCSLLNANGGCAKCTGSFYPVNGKCVLCNTTAKKFALFGDSCLECEKEHEGCSLCIYNNAFGWCSGPFCSGGQKPTFCEVCKAGWKSGLNMWGQVDGTCSKV